MDGTLDPISSYIVIAAAQRGIDPHTALRVARSEGLNEYVGDKGSSFGPYQLHYGGVANGGNAVGGLGDDFTKATGLDARDPGTIKRQIDFALDHVSKHGWGAFHGAAKVGIDDWAGIGGNNQSSRYGALTGVAGGSDPTAAGGAFAPPAQKQPAIPQGYGGIVDPSGGQGSAPMSWQDQYYKQMINQMQPHPGILAQLLFGGKGLSGFMQQHMPNGLFGGGQQPGQPPQGAPAQPGQAPQPMNIGGPGTGPNPGTPSPQSTPMSPQSTMPLQGAAAAGKPMELPGASMAQGGPPMAQGGQPQGFQGAIPSLLSLFGIGGNGSPSS